MNFEPNRWHPTPARPGRHPRHALAARRLRLPGPLAVMLALALAFALAGALAGVQPAAAAESAAGGAATPSASASLAAATAAAAGAAAPAPALAEAGLRIFNRDIVTFRSMSLGLSPTDRSRRAAHRITDQLQQPGPHRVSVLDNPLGRVVLIDGGISFFVTAEDVDGVRDENLDETVHRAAQALEDAIAATRESRRADSVIKASLLSVLATAAAVVALWLTLRLRQAIEQWLLGLTRRQADRLGYGGVAQVSGERLAWLVHGMLVGLNLLLWAVLVYAWLSVVLAQFPYTRVWSRQLDGHLLGLISGLANAIVDAVPGMVTAGLIFLLARFVAGGVDSVFALVRSGQLQLGWVDSDVAEPTRRIAKGVLWLFALAMAYPYLPGAHTEAFKGLSVLVGLMLSIGSSNLVGHAGSGLILTYARVFRRGEYVRIAEHEGTVTELGVFATRLRTGLGEEVTLSNSLVLGAATKNFSRAVRGAGFVLDTTVSIGYDTPWRQVQAMLVQAALRTPGVLAAPAPRVFQTSLSDFYPVYRLVCQAAHGDTESRPLLLSQLHANIQDVFNEHGVQIMSPHYLDDPASPKLVPRSKWHAPPAQD